MSLSAKHTTRLLVAMSALAASMTLMAPTPASATEACIGTTTNGHGIDSDSGDCVYMNVYTAVDGRIVVKYSGNQDYDFYQLRWSRPGRTEVSSGCAGAVRMEVGGRWATHGRTRPIRSRCRLAIAASSVPIARPGKPRHTASETTAGSSMNSPNPRPKIQQTQEKAATWGRRDINRRR